MSENSSNHDHRYAFRFDELADPAGCAARAVNHVREGFEMRSPRAGRPVLHQAHNLGDPAPAKRQSHLWRPAECHLRPPVLRDHDSGQLCRRFPTIRGCASAVAVTSSGRRLALLVPVRRDILRALFIASTLARNGNGSITLWKWARISGMIIVACRKEDESRAMKWIAEHS